MYSILVNYKEQQYRNKKEFDKKYKYYTLKEIKNKYGKVIEYVIVESKSKKDRVEMVFTKRNGCEIKDIAEVLGHRRIETTEKYYISSTDKDKIQVAKSFENSLNIFNNII